MNKKTLLLPFRILRLAFRDFGRFRHLVWLCHRFCDNEMLSRFMESPEYSQWLAGEEYMTKVRKEHSWAAQGFPTVDLLDILPNFDEKLSKVTFLDGGSPPIDVAVLKCLCRKFERCDYLEIGTWRGESVVNIAAVAGTCTSVGLSDNDVVSIGLEETIPLQRMFSKGNPKIRHIAHNSQTFDFTSLDQRFDVIFIDGDHSYSGICSDTENAFRLLKNDDSIVVWHDYTLGPSYQCVRWETLAAICDGSPSTARDNLYHISNTMLAIYTKARYRSDFPSYFEIPRTVFAVSLKGSEYREDSTSG